MAINVAHQLREMEIPVYFISLRGMKSKDELVSKLLSIFADAKQAFHVLPSHWLTQCLQQLANPFVLILDNADDLLESGDAKLKEDIIGFTDEILAQCSHIKLVFTTRESLEYLSHKHPVHLERVAELDEDSSDELVRFLLPCVSNDDCSKIVEECGWVPLAMRLICSTISEENVSVSELLEELKTSPLVEVFDNESFSDDVRLKKIINTSFQRLTDHEKCAFVSLAVFPRWFGVEEAIAVLDFKTVLQTKKIIRSLKRKALLDCSENFSSFIIHSLLRSFIHERRKTDQETGGVFLTAQRRFYDYHLSSFAVANEKFLTGHSNEAREAFLRRQESIMLSLTNGTKDDELYSKAVDALSKAELFLYAILPNEEFFKTIYDTAVNEARKRQNVNDERKLLAAKSFAHWGWFTSDRLSWDHSLQAGFADAAYCPTKLACYFGIHQILCGKLDEGISSLRRSVDYLDSSCDEKVLKLLVYQVLSSAYWKKQEPKMSSSFLVLLRDEAKASSPAVGGTVCSKDFSPSITDDAFLCLVTSNLLYFSATRKAIVSYTPHLMPALIQGFAAFCRSSCIPEAQASAFQNTLAASEAFLQCVLKEPEFITPELALTLRELISFRDQISPNPFSLTSFNQLCEKLLHMYEIFPSPTRTFFGHLLKPLIKEVRNCMKSLRYDLDVDVEALARTYDICGKWLHFVNDYSGALELHQLAIGVREEKIGDHVDSALSLTNIGCMYFKMNNESKAADSFQSALELRKQLGIYDHEDTANIYVTLGENQFTLGNYEKAIEAHLQGLELRRKHLGQHPTTGESLHRLAESSIQLQSYKEALTFCQQALSTRIELLGKHVHTANSFHVLGGIHYKMGDFPSAVEAFQKASDMRSHLLGDHNDTALSYYWLGLAQCYMGDLSKALQSLQNALQLRKKCSIADHPGVADAINGIGHVYFKMVDYQSAREQFHDAVDLYKKLLDKHESTANSCHNLAITYFAMESYPEALEFCQQALTTRMELLGEHVHTANSFYFLGEIYCKMGDFPSAGEAFQKASDIRSNLLGDHEDTALSYYWLGQAQCDMGDFNRALESYQRASTMRLDVLGEHADTANSFDVLGQVHCKMGDYPSAVEAFQKASDIRSNLLGDHEDTALSYYRLGLAQFEMGDLNKALESLQRALQLRRKCSIGDHPGIADIINSIGHVYYKMGDYQSARGQFHDAVDLYKKLLDKHESTANCCHILAVTYLAMESYPEALEFCQQALTMRMELLGEHVHTANSFYFLREIHCKIGDYRSAVGAF